MTIRLLTGWEHGVNPLSVSGQGLVTTLLGTPQVVSEKSRSGRYALKCVVAGDTSRHIWSSAPWIVSGDYEVVARFYFYLEDYTQQNLIFFGVTVSGSTNAATLYFANQLVHPRIQASVGPSGAAYNLGAWNRADVLIGLSSGTRSMLLAINGNELPLHSVSSLAVSNVTQYEVGLVGPATGTVYYDDLIISNDPTDYPFGDGSIEALVPASDGTHNAGTNVIEDNAGTDIGVTTAYDKLNWVPMSTGTTWVRQAVAGADNWAEVNFGDLSSVSAIQGVVGRLAYMSETTSTNNGGCVFIDEDAIATTVWGVSGSLADYSESSIFYKGAVLRTPNGGWDRDAVNALRARIGYSTDATPDPYWRALLVEVAFVSGVGGSTYNDDLSLVRFLGMTASPGLSYASAVSLGRSHTAQASTQTDAQAALSLPRRLGISAQAALTLAASLSLSRSLSVQTAGGASFEGSLALTRGLAVSAVSGLSVESSLSLQRQLAVVETAQTDLYPMMTLAHSRTLSASAQLQAQAALFLEKQAVLMETGGLALAATLSLVRGLSVTDSGGLDLQSSLSLGRILSVQSSPNLTVESSLSLVQRRALSTAVNAIYTTALTLARALSVSAAPVVDYQAAVALLRRLALSAVSEVGSTTYEAALSLARQMTLASTSLATQFVTSEIGRRLVLDANATAVMGSQISLSRSLALSALGGLLLEGALSLGRKAGAVDSASLTAEASIGLGKGVGVSDAPTATLLAQLNLGRVVAISPSISASFEVDAQIGRVLTLTIQGGMVYTEQVALEIFQALSTLSQLIQASINFPARLVIGDQTIWLLTTTDQLVSNNDIIDTETSDLTLKDTDSL